ncbi:hypothetical protein [Bacillus cereus]|uniref:hypothetical protein n=1 Tax=Bacillus cereus TaxID=1396 RepID=UPI000BF6AD75|nr:hypothetical protein [Bacillus cereus]PFS79598.1 hypothetical protein COK49_13810 [Bacillus cereus]
MVSMYAIEIKESQSGKAFLLQDDGDIEAMLVFNIYEDADDYNYEFEDILPDGLTSRVVNANKYF